MADDKSKEFHYCLIISVIIGVLVGCDLWAMAAGIFAFFVLAFMVSISHSIEKLNAKEAPDGK